LLYSYYHVINVIITVIGSLLF